MAKSMGSALHYLALAKELKREKVATVTSFGVQNCLVAEPDKVLVGEL